MTVCIIVGVNRNSIMYRIYFININTILSAKVIMYNGYHHPQF
jgi:hypothetical protein